MRAVARLTILGLLLLLLVPESALAQRGRGRPRPRTQGIAVHFENRDLGEIIDAIARATGRRFVYGDEVRGRVTITVPGRVSSEEALELLFAALHMRGFAPLALDEETIRIVPVMETATGAPLAADVGSARGERPVTTLIKLREADPGEIVASLEPYVSQNGVAVAYPPTNSIILAGTEGQLVRLISIARALDRAAGESLLVRTLRYREAERIVDMVDTIFNDTPVAADRVSLWTDDRTNRVIVQGHPVKLDAIRTFLEGIDVPVEGEGLVKVVRVRNRDAEEMASLLTQLAETPSGPRARPASAGEGEAELGEAEVEDVLVGRDYHIEVDVPTQSLLISADPETFGVLSRVIAELDRLPPRISVEVLVFEVTRPMGFKLGTNYFLPLSNPSSQNDFVVFSNSVGGAVAEPSGDSVAFGRYARSPLLLTFTGPGGSTITVPVPREDVSFEAGERLAETNVLLRPNILGVSGEEHEIFVGTNIPIPAASAPPAPAEDGTVPIQNPLDISQQVERSDIGVRLRVKPVVGQKGVVRVALSLEVSDLVESRVGSVEEVGPTYAKRNLEATVDLRPGEKAVLGSTGAATESARHVGVPFFKDIPFIGFLFGTVEKRRDQVDLIAVVEARALYDADGLAAETIRRRLAFERSISRTQDLQSVGDEPFAVLLETTRSEEAATLIARAFAADGFETRITPWNAWGQDVWDVYVTDLASFEEAGRLARRLADAGWAPEITVLSPVNELAGD